MTFGRIHIIATVIAGLGYGPVVSRAVPRLLPAEGWSSLLFVFIGCAAGLPAVLGYFATSGKYATMIRLWSLFGFFAILFTSIGVSAAAQSAATASREPNSIFFVVVGAGLFAGLGLVKLAILQARSRKGA